MINSREGLEGEGRMAVPGGKAALREEQCAVSGGEGVRGARMPGAHLNAQVPWAHVLAERAATVVSILLLRQSEPGAGVE